MCTYISYHKITQNFIIYTHKEDTKIITNKSDHIEKNLKSNSKIDQICVPSLRGLNLTYECRHIYYVKLQKLALTIFVQLMAG